MMEIACRRTDLRKELVDRGLHATGRRFDCPGGKCAGPVDDAAGLRDQRLHRAMQEIQQFGDHMRIRRICLGEPILRVLQGLVKSLDDEFKFAANSGFGSFIGGDSQFALSKM